MKTSMNMDLKSYKNSCWHRAEVVSRIVMGGKEGLTVAVSDKEGGMKKVGGGGVATFYMALMEVSRGD